MIGGRPEAVLLDRDGTINVKAPDGQYITDPYQVRLLPGAAAAISALNRAGIPVVVVTNQRGIALGRMTEDDLATVHERLRVLLRAHGARLDDIFYCPHDKGVCRCRKPGPLLLQRARDYLGLFGLRRSVMIGDSLSDVLAGQAAGARSILITELTCADDATGFEVVPSLFDAVELLLGREQCGC